MFERIQNQLVDDQGERNPLLREQPSFIHTISNFSWNGDLL
jgi:hypothetical protein